MHRDGRKDLRFDRVTSDPTVDSVITACKRLPWPPTTILKARSYLPFMLERTLYREAGVNVTLRQFAAGQDPFEYYDYCQQVEEAYPETKRCGRWLKSIARLLVCWVAEELKRAGSGNGFDDHFIVKHSAPDTRVTETPVVTPDKGDDAWGARLVEYYDTELHAAETHRHEPNDQRAHAQEKDASDGHATKSAWEEPSYTVKCMRTLANHRGLIKYLHGGANDRAAKKQRINYLNYSDETMFQKVRAYFRDTEEGRLHLKECGVTVDTFTIDHVNARCLGGPNHLWNLHIMPSGANAHFNGRHWMDPEKQRYVGEQQMRYVKKLMMLIGASPIVANVVPEESWY